MIFRGRINKFSAELVFLLLIIVPAFSDTYTLGGKKGWADVTERNGITTGKGRYGYESLALSTDAKKLGDDTDMLLDFENRSFDDRSGNYSIKSNSLYASSKAKIGKGAALSRNRSGGLVLSGRDGSFFSSEGPAGSFSIEFWLCPAVVENSEIIMNWRSSRNLLGEIIYQHITISFYQNKLQCIFSNIFEGYTQNAGDAVLVGSENLIPGKWVHHSIAYQEDSGALTYTVDGQLSDIKFMTDSAHEWGTIYQAVLGVQADIEICPEYMGLIDDVKISRSYENFPSMNAGTAQETDFKRKYKSQGGRFRSVPIMTKKGTALNSIEADMFVPKEAAVQFYIRGGDNYFAWTDDSPEWIPVKSGEDIENLTGLYFQIAAELYPSGDGMSSPEITEITMNYTTSPEPSPPYRISAKGEDGSVTLSWNYSVDDIAGGYYIYYGHAPGEYIGKDAAEGVSPINAGNVSSYTITGLENGKIYYFAVSAWSKIDPRITGILSKEVYARPERKTQRQNP